MSNWRGDYMGFTYNNVHSSDLGIVRVSDGSRFNENLLPTMQDKTVPVPGGDGSYFFGSYYTQRQFNISFAFDDLTEEQLARIRSHFGDKQIYDLIFDEAPYKVYSAKVTGTATLKYIPFAEGATGRLYKGEGTIQFTCFYPFARCNFKTLEECQEYDNWEEWILASRIAFYDEEKKAYVLNGGNFGDRPVSFKVDITETSGALGFGSITWKNLPKNIYIEIDTSKGFKENETYYKINNNKYEQETEEKPIEGIQYYVKGCKYILDTKTGLAKDENGNIYNKYFTGDLTAKIPQGATAEETADLEFTCEYI